MAISAPIACKPLRCWSTGRNPMAQPPGIETRASPQRAARGPRASTEARMVFTSSYGATGLEMRAAVSSTPSFSSIEIATPICASRLSIVVTSRRRGTLVTMSGSSVRSAAVRIGRAAFLAPEISTSPASGTPPSMTSLSMLQIRKNVQSLRFLSRPIFRREGLHRQCVDLRTHPVAQCGVHHLVLLHARLAAKRRAHDHGLEMLTVALHLHMLALEAGPDVLLDLPGIYHTAPYADVRKDNKATCDRLGLFPLAPLAVHRL